MGTRHTWRRVNPTVVFCRLGNEVAVLVKACFFDQQTQYQLFIFKKNIPLYLKRNFLSGGTKHFTARSPKIITIKPS
jgi:hypothetical protein